MKEWTSSATIRQTAQGTCTVTGYVYVTKRTVSANWGVGAIRTSSSAYDQNERKEPCLAGLALRKFWSHSVSLFAFRFRRDPRGLVSSGRTQTMTGCSMGWTLITSM